MDACTGNSLSHACGDGIERFPAADKTDVIIPKLVGVLSSRMGRCCGSAGSSQTADQLPFLLADLNAGSIGDQFLADADFRRPPLAPTTSSEKGCPSAT